MADPSMDSGQASDQVRVKYVRVDNAFERLGLGHVAICGNGGGRFLADVVDHLARRLRQLEIPLACQYSQGSLRILLFFGSENGSTRRLTSR